MSLPSLYDLISPVIDESFNTTTRHPPKSHHLTKSPNLTVSPQPTKYELSSNTAQSPYCDVITQIPLQNTSVSNDESLGVYDESHCSCTLHSISS